MSYFSKWLHWGFTASYLHPKVPTTVPKLLLLWGDRREGLPLHHISDIHPIFLLWGRDCYSNKGEGEVEADIGNCARNCSPRCAVPDLNQRVTLDLIMPGGDFCACLDLLVSWFIGLGEFGFVLICCFF